jgi:ATP adenylyltransferase
MGIPPELPGIMRPTAPAPGALWPAIVERARHALSIGALLPVPTRVETLDDGGVCFLVRCVSGLARKPAAGATGNPFAPYDPELFVADLAPTHVALLNKFPVIEHHLLIVTRRFEPQDSALTERDFAALAGCMAEFDGLGFYNAGTGAGASQRHKHLQWVPLPLGPGTIEVPIEALLERAPPPAHPAAQPGRAAPTRIERLPFEHSFVHLDPPLFGDPDSAGERLAAHYRDLLRTAGIGLTASDRGPMVAQPYNLLVTRRWMLCVPRTQECFDSISVNALGFAGSLLVQDQDQLDRVRRHGPLAVLRGVAQPRR